MKFTKEKYKEINQQLQLLIKQGLTSIEIANKLGISKSAVFRNTKKLGITIPNYHNFLKFDNTVFDVIDSEEKAYWLGFLYADGNVSKDSNIVSLNLKYSDKEHLEKFKSFLKTSAEIKLRTVKTLSKAYRCCSLQVCNKHFRDNLCKLGCVPTKSLILKFPNVEIFKCKDLIYHFIRGYVDGDGCLTFSKNGRLELSILGTQQFLEGIQKVFPYRFKSIHHIKRTKSDICKISNCGENADYVASLLYRDATIYLKRKHDRFAVLCRNI